MMGWLVQGWMRPRNAPSIHTYCTQQTLHSEDRCTQTPERFMRLSDIQYRFFTLIWRLWWRYWAQSTCEILLVGVAYPSLAIIACTSRCGHGLGCALNPVTLYTNVLSISRGADITYETPERVQAIERIRYACRSGPAHAKCTI
jgi:hypothetical protein